MNDCNEELLLLEEFNLFNLIVMMNLRNHLIHCNHLNAKLFQGYFYSLLVIFKDRKQITSVHYTMMRGLASV